MHDISQGVDPPLGNSQHDDQVLDSFHQVGDSGAKYNQEHRSQAEEQDQACFLEILLKRQTAAGNQRTEKSAGLPDFRKQTDSHGPST